MTKNSTPSATASGTVSGAASGAASGTQIAEIDLRDSVVNIAPETSDLAEKVHNLALGFVMGVCGLVPAIAEILHRDFESALFLRP